MASGERRDCAPGFVDGTPTPFLSVFTTVAAVEEGAGVQAREGWSTLGIG